MSMLPLLIELGTEELPPKALPELAQAFFDGIDSYRITRQLEQSRRVTASQTGLYISACAAGIIHA